MVHRPDPTDLNPMKVVLYGLTPDLLPFTTGFWTRDFTLASPPVLGDFTAFVNKVKPLCWSNIQFVGGAWKLRGGTVFTTIPFATPVNGTHDAAFIVESNSATLGYGGLAVDHTGATRNIRSFSHVPRGAILANEVGDTVITRADTDVAAFLNWWGTLHPTDPYGRGLNQYGYMTLQNNAYYQSRSGF